jgi:hypothetical protein
MKDAFARADTFARQQYGDDWKPVMAFGDHAFSVDGKPQPVTWRFNFVGHLQGGSDWSYAKIQVQPDGQAFVDSDAGGPFPDGLKLHEKPVMDLAHDVSPEDGLALLKQGNGSKYAPKLPISWETEFNDRLQQKIVRYTWVGTNSNADYACDTAFDAVTGTLLENNVDAA